MIICGLDPGLHHTGYGIIEAERNSFKLMDAGLISTCPGNALPDRLLKLYRDLDELFTEYPRLSMVAVEELYSHYRHPRTAVLMGHARGVILLAACGHNIEIKNLPSTMVKKAIAGTGHAGKAQIQRAVFSRLAIRPDPGIPVDVTDALALAICGFEHSTGRT
jgi:crossover junction endodeoxyribonuclease RuvC